MNQPFDRIAELARALDALLAQEREQASERGKAARDILGALRADSRDLRLRRLAELVREWHAGIDGLLAMARRDYLDKLLAEVASGRAELPDRRLAAVLAALLSARPAGLAAAATALLDALIAATRAGRGFVLFWQPETTAAEVAAARNFQSTDLSVAEYRLSRTLLRDILGGRPLLLEDAAAHPAYAATESVRDLELRSVLGVPLRSDGRVVGVVYLEEDTRPLAFDEADLDLLASAVEAFVAMLEIGRMLPVVPESGSPVYLDEARAGGEIVGRDPQVLAILDLVDRVADAPAAVLVEGESGTGKELVARALHERGRRRGRPFVAVNCAAIPEALLESELFGHEKGAFTGAAGRYAGRAEQADGGTLFFDEVGDLAPALQAKLLRFLQSGEFQRLGGRETLRSDVRVVAATSRDLQALMAAGKFMEALYFRVRVIPLRIPPLRERAGDIPLLAEHFLEKFNAVYGREASLAPGVTECLQTCPFPGNVRELENLVHRLVAVSRGGWIRLDDLPPEYRPIAAGRILLAPPGDGSPPPPRDLAGLRARRRELRREGDRLEAELIRGAVAEAGGSVTEAARRLGLHRVTLHKLLRRAGGAPIGSEDRPEQQGPVRRGRARGRKPGGNEPGSKPVP